MILRKFAVYYFLLCRYNLATVSRHALFEQLTVFANIRKRKLLVNKMKPTESSNITLLVISCGNVSICVGLFS